MSHQPASRHRAAAPEPRGPRRRADWAAALMVLATALALAPGVRQAGSAYAAEGDDLAGAGLLAGWTDANCGSCHQRDAAFSHPVNVEPSMPVPAHLPLVDGKLACITCHLGTAEAHFTARSEHQPMLRSAADGRTLCQECHDARQSGRGHQHGAAIGRAHLDKIPEAAGTNASGGSVVRPGARLDSQSLACLGCHDGSLATDAGQGMGSQDRIGQEGPAGEHPVGVEYLGGRRTTGPRDRAIPLVAAGSLDQRVRLFDGRVGCGSCHSPYAREAKLLVMSNRGSQLCLSCHDLR